MLAAFCKNRPHLDSPLAQFLGLYVSPTTVAQVGASPAAFQRVTFLRRLHIFRPRFRRGSVSCANWWSEWIAPQRSAMRAHPPNSRWIS